MTWEHTAAWLLVAIVIGGIMSIVKRGAKTSARWWKDGMLPVLPIAIGIGAAFIPGVLEGAVGVRVLEGIAAGLAAGWVYDRWADRMRRN